MSMERGLLIELRPNEANALHRVAQGLMLTEDMAQHHLIGLKQLALVEETGTDFKLTVLGIRRLALRGNTQEDRALIERALRLFEEMKATGWIEEARAALAAASPV
jgi:hypothetical protein